MTIREQEILEYIKLNPMISQQDLANILGIERSSVAVHISNLVKKGIIKGKGYIIEPKKYVLVIGGSNIDILGTPDKTLIMEDSNPGKISTSPGGVGRNIAENIALLGLNCKLLSAVGKDLYGNQILEKTSVSGVDTHYVKQLLTKSTSTYLSILDETGDMKVALSDMSITEDIDITYIKKNEDLIKNASLIVLDTNLEESVLEYIVHTFTESRFIVDTVSTTKAIKIIPLLSKLFCIKPNRVEAEILLNMTINNDDDILSALQLFAKVGITHPMVTLGKKGVAYLNNNKLMIIPSSKISIVNANGAGDAFTAGITYGFYQNKSISDTIKIGNTAAKIALESEKTVNPNMTIYSILNNIKTGGQHE